ncbi:phage protein [Streptococcus pyogenes]|nr:phage protein [Streptococcus pyogenes]
MLIAENAMQAEAIKNQNRQIAELRSIIQQNAQAINREFAAVKGVCLDNQAAITNIAVDINYVKKTTNGSGGRNRLFHIFKNFLKIP